MATVDLCKMVAEQVEKTPDVVAVIYDGEEERCSVKLTYREMWKRASKVSQHWHITLDCMFAITSTMSFLEVVVKL